MTKVVTLQDSALTKLMTNPPASNDVSVVDRVKELTGAYIHTETRFPDNGDTYTVLADVHKPRSLTASQLEAARETVARSMLPAPPAELSVALLKLRMKTAGPKSSADDLEVQNDFYVEEMSQYPADIALRAIQSRWIWFPSVTELQEVADKLMIVRKTLKRTLDAWEPWTDADELAHLEAKRDELYTMLKFARDGERDDLQAQFDSVETKISELGGSRMATETSMTEIKLKRMPG